MIEESKSYLFVVEQIKEDHIREANLLIHDPTILKNLISRIEKQCKRLAEFLTAAQVRRYIYTGPLGNPVLLRFGILS